MNRIKCALVRLEEVLMLLFKILSLVMAVIVVLVVEVWGVVKVWAIVSRR